MIVFAFWELDIGQYFSRNKDPGVWQEERLSSVWPREGLRAPGWSGEFRNVLRRGLLRLGRLEPQEQKQERLVVRSEMATPGGGRCGATAAVNRVAPACQYSAFWSAQAQAVLTAVLQAEANEKKLRNKTSNSNLRN